MNNKIAILIDGNYFFHKTFGVFAGFGEKNPGDVLSHDGERNMFMVKVITDLCYTLNQVPNISKVIFCKDSRSWRKDFKISRSVYKENRVKSEGVDWGSFFKLLDEFGDFLEKSGFIFSRVNGAEGDDLIWGWKEDLRDLGYSVLVLTGDKDMNQTVDSDDKGWTCIWNANSKKNKITTAPGFKILEDEYELSIFDVTPTSDESIDKLKKLLNSSSIDEIDIKEFIFKKILTGDEGDNVPTVYPFKTKTGTNSGIKKGRADKIWENYLKSEFADLSMEQLWDDQKFLEWLASISLRIIAQTDNKENREKFKNYYKENAILVWLNAKTIPENIVNDIKDHVALSLDRSGNDTPITEKKLLIEKSPWNGTAQPPRGFDPFALFS